LLFLVHGGQGTFFQRLAIPDHIFAAVVRQLKILRQFERVRGTRVFAQPAEHTPAEIVGEISELFAAGLLIALAGNHNQVLGTGQRASVSGFTLSRGAPR
jgi:hypothetical protein